jgi:hypothetical protein
MNVLCLAAVSMLVIRHAVVIVRIVSSTKGALYQNTFPVSASYHLTVISGDETADLKTIE